MLVTMGWVYRESGVGWWLSRTLLLSAYWYNLLGDHQEVFQIKVC